MSSKTANLMNPKLLINSKEYFSNQIIRTDVSPSRVLYSRDHEKAVQKTQYTDSENCLICGLCIGSVPGNLQFLSQRFVE
jgi:NAD-dependent dihydropyrimidine dehydrogenase PreA subunit